MDIRQAAYFRRSTIAPSSSTSCTTTSKVSCTNSKDMITVEQRFYAHRTIPSVLVMEVEIVSGGSSKDSTLPYAMLLLENKSPVVTTPDVNFTTVATPATATKKKKNVPPFSINFGWTQTPEVYHLFCPVASL